MLGCVRNGGGRLASEFGGNNRVFGTALVSGGDGLNCCDVLAVNVDAAVFVDGGVDCSARWYRCGFNSGGCFPRRAGARTEELPNFVVVPDLV